MCDFVKNQQNTLDNKLEIMVHPARSCGCGEAGDAGRTRRVTVFAPPPGEGMAMGISVLRVRFDGIAVLPPRREAARMQGQGAPHLPPRLDQVR